MDLYCKFITFYGIEDVSSHFYKHSGSIFIRIYLQKLRGIYQIIFTLKMQKTLWFNYLLY